MEPGVGRPSEGLVIGSEEFRVPAEGEDQLVQRPVSVEVQRILRHRLAKRGDRFLTASEMLQNIGLVVSQVRKPRRPDFRAFEVRKCAGEIALRTTRPAQVFATVARCRVVFARSPVAASTRSASSAQPISRGSPPGRFAPDKRPRGRSAEPAESVPQRPRAPHAPGGPGPGLKCASP